jgi:excisionase family DNA binding protein
MPDQSTLPAFLSTEEAAKLLNVHINTIVRWIKTGALPSSRIGREYRIPKEAIENRLAIPISEFGVCSCGFLVHPL